MGTEGQVNLCWECFFKCWDLMQNFYDSEHIAVCMFQDENWQNIEIQILELLKEHLLNEYDEKQERKGNLDMKAPKSESSEKKRGKTRFSHKAILINLTGYEWFTTNTHKQKDFLGCMPTCRYGVWVLLFKEPGVVKCLH